MPLKVSRNVDADELLKKATGENAVTKGVEDQDTDTIEDLEAQLAAEDDKGLEPDSEEEAGGKADVDFSPTQQQRLQGLIDKTVAVERRRNERNLKKIFGTADLGRVADVYAAGQALSSASGKSPQELVRYVQERSGGGQTPTGGLGARSAPQLAPTQLQALEVQLAELRNLVAGQRDQERREVDVKAAKTEFGALYDQHQLDIEDKAEELGISLLDAAAVVLRPHLKTVTEQRAQARRQSVREQKVASTKESGQAGGKLNIEELLTPRQKLTAKKMNLTYKEYAEQLREISQLERP